MAASILTIGVTMTVTGLSLFFYGLQATEDIITAQTLLFTFIVTVEMAVIQVIRSRFDQRLLSNWWLVAAVAVSFGFQLLVLYTPLNALFDVRSLSVTGWGWIGIDFVVFLIVTVFAERYLV